MNIYNDLTWELMDQNNVFNMGQFEEFTELKE